MAEMNNEENFTGAPCGAPAPAPVPPAVKDMNVIFVQDVSGSMQDERRSVANGINEIVGDLQTRYNAPCEYSATVRVITFSSHDNIIMGSTVPVQDVQVMRETDLKCNGMTALWDTVAIAIDCMNAESAGVPATTYIFTDGDDNDSRKFGKSRINEMIADNKKRNPMHSILFIGSDPSAKRNAEGMGLDRMHSIQHGSDNTPVAYEVCRRALGRCVSGDTQSTEFNHDDIVLSETPSAPRGYASPTTTTPTTMSAPMTDSQPCDYVFESDDTPSGYH